MAKTTLIIRILTIVTFSLLSLNVAFAVTTTIQITRTPYLSFYEIPESFQISTGMETPSSNTEITSDASGANLPSSRYLTVQDTRQCGGFSLQVQASAFSPAPTSPNPSLNNGLRLVTSTHDAMTGGSVESGIRYTADEGTFSGSTGVIAPLNTASTSFADPTIFTSAPFDTGSNILLADTPVDVMQGGLTAPNGRDGLIHVSTSYYLLIPKFFAAGSYYTKLTYTLMDDTTGAC